MLRRSFIALPALTLLMAAAPDPGVAMLENLFRASKVDPAWFDTRFTDKIPVAQVQTLLDSIREQLGALRSVSGSGQHFLVHLERGDLTATLVLNGEGKITGLLLRPATTQGSLDDHVRTIAALPGQTSILILRNDTVLAGLHETVPLAVGSAFKLAVLKAVVTAIDQKRLAWDQVVPLDPAWQSLPSGVLQDWPAATPLTIAALTDLMISISDNTAADALIALAGREAVEAVSPRNAPFLTTREAFVLKNPANAALRAAWTQADVKGRRALLPKIAAAALPSADALTATPSLAIDWYFTAAELAALLTDLRNVPALGINPGLANRSDWRAIAFKGGSEPGCINLSTLVTAHDGTRYAVVVTWNGPDAGQEKLAIPYGGILQSLARGRA